MNYKFFIILPTQLYETKYVKECLIFCGWWENYEKTIHILI